ncbi:glycosyltransferase [Marinobacter sp. NP-4(2019)]|uniref:TIGR04282 family arsenosugar biosynthesis glycosyltransferase n=1 Tax=Marinobacter sp. NP-4(2019) TaxID=2488665 RepID=UPI000FC3F3DE|nr:TIGR04282 family arsenosugar biosynthesis glycosyltransferase [Marinobacter sp. NP-4(2019)]AZT83439.1 glycosyltransferase [Marinobacter sp. NP-4(2019)]
MPKSPESSVLVMQFSKWPEEGRVKTRLMPALGAGGALAAHVRLSLAVLDNLIASGFPVQFWWDRALETAPAAAAPVLSKLDSAQIATGVQQGENLGRRMEAALAGVLEDHDKALVVGSDCPSVDSDYIRQAVAELDTSDVVLGPSNDGGYVMIGARRVVAGMLDGVNWGTGSVLDQTCARLEGLGLSVSLLPPRWDVDEPEDWQRFLDQSPG